GQQNRDPPCPACGKGCEPNERPKPNAGQSEQRRVGDEVQDEHLEGSNAPKNLHTECMFWRQLSQRVGEELLLDQEAHKVAINQLVSEWPGKVAANDSLRVRTIVVR